MSLESLRLKPIFLVQYVAISRETDPQLRGEALLRLAGELEASDDWEAAAGIYGGLQADKTPKALANLAERRLEALKGRGNFGAQFELCSRRFVQQSSDPRLIVPMLVGSTVFQLGRTMALGRLTPGFGARSVASLVGFAMEVPTFVLLHRRLSPSGSSWSQDLRQSALSLGVLKLFAFGGQRAALKLHGKPIGISQASGLLGLFAVHRVEQALGWRPESSLGISLTETLATWLSLGIGTRLGETLLGKRFAAFHRELAIRAEAPPRFGSGGIFAESVAGAAVSETGPTRPKVPANILMMSSEPKEGRTPISSQDLVSGYRGGSPFATPADLAQASRDLRAAMLDVDLPPDQRLEHLETFGRILKMEEEQEEYPLGLKDLRSLILHPKIEWPHPVQNPVQSVPFYAHHLLLRRTAAELYVNSVEEHPFGHPEVESGVKALREVLEDPRIPTKFKPTFGKSGKDLWWRSYFQEAESQTLRQLLPIYARLTRRLGTESPEVYLGFHFLASKEFQAMLHGSQDDATDGPISGSLAKAYAGLLSASSMFNREMAKKEMEKLHPNIVCLKGLAERGDDEALRALGVLAEFDDSARKDLLDLKLMGIPGLKEKIAAAESEAKALKKLRDGQMTERVQPVSIYDINGRHPIEHALLFLGSAISKVLRKL